MKKWKRYQKGIVWALALALLLTLLAVPEAYGAGGIETERGCSITIQLDGQFPELDNLPIPVKLYRVASVGADGSYALMDAFAGLDADALSEGASAETWSKLAEEAADKAQKDAVQPTAQIQIQKLAGEEHATGQAEHLATGLYLVEAETVQSGEYVYEFIPYLAALPNNYYASTGDDAWVYDVESELKPEQTPRYGRLVIEKTLEAYNATLGGASFVFQVEATKDGKSVYSDVMSLAFDGTGTKSLEIGGFPAGAQVTVTEVYSGACYTATTSTEQTAVIVAEGDNGDPARVQFVNTYDERNNGGTSIVNHFYYADGEWKVQQQEDSSGE